MFLQLDAFIGSQGITPAAQYMARARKAGLAGAGGLKLTALCRLSWQKLPTLCWYSTSDRFLRALVGVPMLLSLLAACGVLPLLAMAVCLVCYFSLIQVSGDMMGLQMHVNMIETNALYVVSKPFMSASPLLICFLNWVLVFRIMVGGAAGKWAGGDTTWSALLCCLACVLVFML